MKRTWLRHPALLALLSLSVAGCTGSERLYLSAKKDVLLQTLDVEKNQMVQRFIYNGSDLSFDYPLERAAEVDRVGFQLLLATREATSVRVSASLVQSGSVITLGSEVLEVKGNQGKRHSGLIKGQKLRAAPGDILRLTMSNTGSNEAVLFLTPAGKDASFVTVRLH
jgi:hypothetical protein